ncbi:ParB/RepB/Spo0J family partition protein [Arcticibacter pallidicorallinus]|uniref:ParB/RepB/Spo0J family partition protein n=1 Tax=Arcticibacter pallidicorallinus TaxID=1259464 RepID=A0A2T0U0Q9_9SPHI|nr:ParB/RepB/Spo0J family partition protein [Arcticibacter pallidicorallinus]PRY51501.1 ParB/RepB/Spo0J family partition protein [Arcticibacter pallidicorallinus]
MKELPWDITQQEIIRTRPIYQVDEPVTIKGGNYDGRSGRFNRYCSNAFPDYCRVTLELKGRLKTEETVMVELKNLQRISTEENFNNHNMKKQNVPTPGSKIPAEEAGVPTISMLEPVFIAPSKLNPRKEFDQVAIDELAASIKKLGLIQAITVRPDADGYEIVCGERRYHASIKAGLKQIPVIIRNLSDNEAMELMVTENLQRKDVHPMEEADAFMMMRDKMNYTITDIAAKIGKNEAYVLRRLHLVNLVPTLNDLFLKSDISIGHAELLSRVGEDDQELWFKDKYSSGYGGGVGTVRDLKQWLSYRVERKLSEAPFDPADVFRGKGFSSPVCSNCHFNSAFQQDLFPDNEAEAICHNSKCFEAKSNDGFEKKLFAAVADPNTIFVNENYGGNDLIANTLKKDGFTVLKKYDDYEELPSKPRQSSYNWAGSSEEENRGRFEAALKSWEEKKASSIKAFSISTHSKGEIVSIVLKSTKRTAEKTTESDPMRAYHTLKADIDQRIRRGREIDQEKIMKQVIASRDQIPFKLSEPDETRPELSEAEMNALYVLCYESCSYSSGLNKHLGLSRSSYYNEGKQLLEEISNLPQHMKSFIVRQALINKFAAIGHNGISHAITLHLAKDWCPDVLTRIELDQEGKRDRREEKLNKSLKDLKEQFKVEA